MWNNLELGTKNNILLDELDHALLNHFQKHFPRPNSLDFCAVWLRRNTPLLECSISPYFIHLHTSGQFRAQEKELLKLWIEDLLRAEPSSNTDVDHCLTYLVLYQAIGGRTSKILNKNINHTLGSPLYQAIVDCFEPDPWQLDDEWIRTHYLSEETQWKYGKIQNYIQPSWVESVITELKKVEHTVAASIAMR